MGPLLQATISRRLYGILWLLIGTQHFPAWLPIFVPRSACDRGAPNMGAKYRPQPAMQKFVSVQLREKSFKYLIS